MSATSKKQTYTVVVVNKPMCGTDNIKPRIQCYEVDRRYIQINKQGIKDVG